MDTHCISPKLTPDFINNCEQLDLLPGELWKDIRGFEGKYMVSNKSRVKSINGKHKGEKIINGSIDFAGYRIFSFRKNGVKKYKRLHQLLAEAFIPNPENKKQVNHKDGVKSNNNLDNLEWCTQSENLKHAHKTGLTDNKGTNNGQAKLSEKEVREIRALYRTGKFIHKDLANKYKVCRRQIGDIINGKNWGWLD